MDWVDADVGNQLVVNENVNRVQMLQPKLVIFPRSH